MKELARFVLGLMLLTLFVLVSSKYVDASHNPPAKEDRGYNKENCESLSSKVTGNKGEWLGHFIGCIIEDKNGYVLIKEYNIDFLSNEQVFELRKLLKQHKPLDNLEPIRKNSA